MSTVPTITTEGFAQLEAMMQRPKERDRGYDPWDDILEGCDWDAYWSARDEADDQDRLVLDCGDPDCIMSGYHRLSECITAEEVEGIYADFEYLSRPFRTVFRPVGLRGSEKPYWFGGVTWWPCAFAAMERPGQR